MNDLNEWLGGALARAIDRSLDRSMVIQYHRKKNRTHQKVWTVKDGNLVKVSIIIGETDDTNSEVKSGDLKAGDVCVIKTAPKGGPSNRD